MNNILNVARSGLDALQKRIDTISNNIANTSTKGYKRLDQDFQELLRNEIGDLGTPLTTELEAKNPTMGSGVKVSEAHRIFEQGSLSPSSNPLEAAIQGNGFFGMEDENGNLLLSRVGEFSINKEGELIDGNGKIVSVEDAEDLQDYNLESIVINQTGEMYVLEDNELENVGRIVLYDVKNKESLMDAESGYFRVPDDVEILESIDSNTEEHFGAIKQGYTETSNVQLGEEMIGLMVYERAYQLNAKSLKAADEMWQQTNNLRR